MATVAIRVRESGTTVEVDLPRPCITAGSGLTATDTRFDYQTMEPDKMTWKHVAITLIIVVGVVTGIAAAVYFISRADIEGQRTERTRLETCGRLEDPEQRIICIRGLD